EGAVDTAAGALGSICLIGARRCSVSPHTEHTKIRRSKPGGQSSPITCSNDISAPHTKQRMMFNLLDCGTADRTTVWGTGWAAYSERMSAQLRCEYAEANLPHEWRDHENDPPRSPGPALALRPPEAEVSTYAQGPSLSRNPPLPRWQPFPAKQQCCVRTHRPRQWTVGLAC